MKKLTRGEYAERFKREFVHVWEKDEEIIQCNEHYDGYYFVSNMGHVYSLAKKNIIELKPSLVKDHVWVYEMNRDGKKKKIKMHRFIAEHFCKDEFGFNEKNHVHHINPKKNFSDDEPQKCNRVDNLQILPGIIHERATGCSENNIDKTIAEKVNKENAPVILIDGSYTKSIIDFINANFQEQMGVRYSVDGESVEAHPVKGLIEWIPDDDDKQD